MPVTDGTKIVVGSTTSNKVEKETAKYDFFAVTGSGDKNDYLALYDPKSGKTEYHSYTMLGAVGIVCYTSSSSGFSLADKFRDKTKELYPNADGIISVTAGPAVQHNHEYIVFTGTAVKLR